MKQHSAKLNSTKLQQHLNSTAKANPTEQWATVNQLSKLKKIFSNWDSSTQLKVETMLLLHVRRWLIWLAISAKSAMAHSDWAHAGRPSTGVIAEVTSTASAVARRRHNSQITIQKIVKASLKSCCRIKILKENQKDFKKTAPWKIEPEGKIWFYTL